MVAGSALQPGGPAAAAPPRVSSTLAVNPPRVPPSLSFKVPKDGEIFVASIRDRCEQLISADVWAGLEAVRLHAWLSNFAGPVETYFAACILDALVYRSSEQTVALMHQQMERTLPDHGRLHPTPLGYGADWLTLLRTPDGGLELELPRFGGSPALRVVAL